MKTNRGAPEIAVSICGGALQAVFDECDRYDRDETGGRVVGTFELDRHGSLNVKVAGVIEPGPNAQRSSSSFFQDGDYQARVFRKIEEAYPAIEHLGNWHTHHVNGYPTLSGGDIETYHRIVNHEKHNLDFFYALLVVARNPTLTGLQRYQIRHYVLFRGDGRVYELKPDRVTITDQAPVWPGELPRRPAMAGELAKPDATVRASDKEMLGQLYSEIRPYKSKQTETIYWKGPVRLIDGSVVVVTIPELEGDRPGSAPYYQVLLKNAPAPCGKIVEELNERQFPSATLAVHGVQNTMNRALYEALTPAAR